jgi:hypothetical protein
VLDMERRSRERLGDSFEDGEGAARVAAGDLNGQAGAEDAERLGGAALAGVEFESFKGGCRHPDFPLYVETRATLCKWLTLL